MTSSIMRLYGVRTSAKSPLHLSGILHPGDIVHTINGWTTRGNDIDTVADHMVSV